MLLLTKSQSVACPVVPVDDVAVALVTASVAPVVVPESSPSLPPAVVPAGARRRAAARA
ncbi:MAG: hypothetical protein KC468_13475 [Myxococcales bacterium]|nr:hypothetical protein [Myxococcales bacterium]